MVNQQMNKNLPMLAHEQIEHVDSVEIPELVPRLPYDCHFKNNFRFENDLWRFQFECHHVAGTFQASTLGRTPREAFAVAKYLILKQVTDWHKTRFSDVVVDEPALAKISLTLPKVLVVDDDVDLALAIQTAFMQMGYQTEVATRYENLHRQIVDCDANYIFLDWQLNNNVTAGQVMERASLLINTFSDLREKFLLQPPRVVTYSVLDRAQVHLPAVGQRYFSHVDHWQKPLPFHEVVERASGLLAAS